MTEASDPPAADPPGGAPSLFDAVSARMRRKEGGARLHSREEAEKTPDEGRSPAEWRTPLILAAILAAGPAIGLVVVNGMARSERAALARSAATETDAERAALAVERGIAVQRAAFDRPGPATIAARIAPLLPDEARIVRMALDAGKLSMEIAVADPDALRRALRREPALARLRESGQQRGDGVMIVSLEAR